MGRVFRAGPGLKNRLWRLFIHIFVGVGSILLLVWLGPVACILWTAMFALYELSEDWHIRNGAWVDIAGWLWGFFIAAAVKHFFC